MLLSMVKFDYSAYANVKRWTEACLPGPRLSGPRRLANSLMQALRFTGRAKSAGCTQLFPAAFPPAPNDRRLHDFEKRSL